MTRKDALYGLLTQKVKEIVSSDLDGKGKLKTICRLLKDNVSYIDWIGFYLVDKEKPRELVLGPFEGEPTEHVRIPFGKGICGQAASLKKTFTVQDVSKETNYLSCSSKVKSEIVNPIFKNRKLVGELDIDSHTASPFSAEDEAFLRTIAQMVSEVL